MRDVISGAFTWYFIVACLVLMGTFERGHAVEALAAAAFWPVYLWEHLP